MLQRAFGFDELKGSSIINRSIKLDYKYKVLSLTSVVSTISSLMLDSSCTRISIFVEVDQLMTAIIILMKKQKEEQMLN